MPSDIRAQQARQHHRAAASEAHQARMHRQQRNALIVALRADDPAYWTHKRLAAEISCSKELIAAVLSGRT